MRAGGVAGHRRRYVLESSFRKVQLLRLNRAATDKLLRLYGRNETVGTREGESLSV